ncbi:MFS transporter [Klebsiella pneumoniae]
MYLRRWLQETPIFLEMQQRKALAQELPVKAVALKHQKAVVISMLLTWLLSAGVVVVILMSPVWLQKHYGFAPAITLQANSIATIMLCIGCLLAGLAADRFGASRTFIVGSLLLAVASWAFYHLAGASPQRLFLLYGTVGLCVGVVGAVPYVMVRAFPAEVRFTGISFLLQPVVRDLWRPDADCGHHADGGVADGAGLVCAGPVADGAGIRYLAASGADGADGDAGRGAAALTMAS